MPMPEQGVGVPLQESVAAFQSHPCCNRHIPWFAALAHGMGVPSQRPGKYQLQPLRDAHPVVVVSSRQGASVPEQLPWVDHAQPGCAAQLVEEGLKPQAWGDPRQ